MRKNGYCICIVLVLFLLMHVSVGISTAASPKKKAEPSLKSYDDVRGENLSQMNFAGHPKLLGSLWFNDKTIWPQKNHMPRAVDPADLMQQAKNPGLGVRRLHQEGITGKGVHVAVIDQPLFQDHPEFTGKIIKYHDVGCGDAKGSMHGPAVASLLAGATCGTAPDVRIYYVAAPSWTKDSAYQAQALDWIVAENQNLPTDKKIRVVSVSAAPSGGGSPFTKNQWMWDEACAKAEKEGILVLDCTSHRGFIGPCWYDLRRPDKVVNCTPGYPGQSSSPGVYAGKILAPASPRTTAEEYTEGDTHYQYCGRGGLSWAIPYVAGVLALGWQVHPDLSPKEVKDLLFRSACTVPGGGKVIDPREFVRRVRSAR